MGHPKVLPKIPELLRSAPEAANDNLRLTARQVAEKRWVGPAAKEAVKLGIVAGGVEFGIIAVPLAFVGPMGIVAYKYLENQKYYDNNRFVPCGSSSVPYKMPQFKPSKFSTQFFAEHQPSSLEHSTTALDAVARNTLLSYVKSSSGIPAIDKPPQGTTVPVWLNNMADAVRIATEIADKQIEILQHRQNGDAHLARRTEQELNALQAEIQSMRGASPMQGHRLQAMASADGGGSSVGGGDVSKRDDAKEDNNLRMLAGTMLVANPRLRLTMLTGDVSFFVEMRQWDSVALALPLVSETVGELGLNEAESRAALAELFAEITYRLPTDIEHIPDNNVCQLLAQFVSTQFLAVGKSRDVALINALESLQSRLQGLERARRALTATPPTGTDIVVPVAPKLPRSIKILISVAQNEWFYSLRLMAVEALGKINTPKSTEALIAVLGGARDYGVSMRAIKILGDRRAANAIPTLTVQAQYVGSWIESEDWGAMALAAVEALEKINTQESLGALTVVVASQAYRSVRLRGIAILGERRHTPAIPVLRTMLDSEKNLEKAVLQTLGMMDTARSVRDLEEYVARLGSQHNVYALAILNESRRRMGLVSDQPKMD